MVFFLNLGLEDGKFDDKKSIIDVNIATKFHIFFQFSVTFRVDILKISEENNLGP